MRKKSKRLKKSAKAVIPSDRVYNSPLVTKLINYVMRRGKKAVAQRVVYGAMEIIREKAGKEPLEVLELAVRNASPILEVKSRRIGGATYQVPREVHGKRKLLLAMGWILQASRSKRGKPMAEKLAAEILAASRNEGEAVKKKENMHRMAEANRAFAHYAW